MRSKRPLSRNKNGTGQNDGFNSGSLIHMAAKKVEFSRIDQIFRRQPACMEIRLPFHLLDPGQSSHHQKSSPLVQELILNHRLNYQKRQKNCLQVFTKEGVLDNFERLSEIPPRNFSTNCGVLLSSNFEKPSTSAKSMVFIVRGIMRSAC